MKKNRFPRVYLLVVLAVMYLPILLVVLYSFNESKITSIWGGFSLTWYETLFRDKAIFEALRNSLVLAGLTCLASAVIGTLGAVGMQRLQSRTKGPLEYISTLPIMIPEIILGIGFMVFFSLLGLPFGMTTLVIGHSDIRYSRRVPRKPLKVRWC